MQTVRGERWGCATGPGGAAGCSAAVSRRRRWRAPVRVVPPLRAAGSVTVRFQLPYHCKYGQRLCLVGGDEKLGRWQVEQAVPMNWTEGDVWVVDLQLPSE